MIFTDIEQAAADPILGLNDALMAEGVTQDFSFIKQQMGMFSFSGLNKDQVKQLREQFAIYIVGSGRISVAGMTTSNIPVICKAIARVL